MWALFVLQSLGIAVYSLGRPAMGSLSPRLVPEEEFAAASALFSVYNSLGAVAGPALAGLLIAFAGFPWTYGIDAVTYLASLVAIWSLPRLPPLEEIERPSVRSIVDGFRFLKGRQALIGIFAIDTNAMVFGMPSALFPAIALIACTATPRRSATSPPRRMRARSPARCSRAGRRTCVVWVSRSR